MKLMQRGTIACMSCGRKQTTEVCPKCNTATVFIRIGYQGRKYAFFHDKHGNAFTVETAASALITINNELLEHTFNPKDYLSQTIDERLFQNAFEAFMDKKEASPKFAPSNKYRTYQKYFGYFEGKDVRDLRLKHLETFYRELPAHLSPKYRNNIMSCLFAFLRWLLRWGEIKELPVLPELDPNDSIPREAPSYEDQQAALARIPEAHRDIVEFIMETGVRPGEACALKVRDINFMHGKVLVQRTLSASMVRENTKGHRRSWRTLSTRACEIIEANCRGGEEDDFVFINPVTGRYYSTEFLRVLWRDHSGLPYDLYSNRHALCTQLAESGASQQEVQALMDHADARSTQRYFRPTPTRQRTLLDQRGGSNVIKFKRRKK